MLASATRVFWIRETTSVLSETLSPELEESAAAEDGRRARRRAVRSICDSARWMPSRDIPKSLIPDSSADSAGSAKFLQKNVRITAARLGIEK
jgi:hypothetical protein